MMTPNGDALGVMGPKNPLEESLLLACSTSDIPAITKVLKRKNEINISCVDILGRTPLQLAIENDDIEVTKLLLPHCDGKNVEDCLLFALSLSSENLAMAILKHPRYQEIEEENTKKDDTSFDNMPSQSKFPTNTTPLVLAAEKNLYEVVRHLLMKGETISVPHSLVCACSTCFRKSQKDHFRFAHERLNAYRGLASEAYISLLSEDPILEAFTLRQTMVKLSEREEHFKAEYLDLAKNLSAYSVKLLNKVIGDRELDAVLNKVGRCDQDLYVPLGRLKLAVKLQEKRFVAHPSCQMRLKKLWYEGFEALSRGHIVKRFAIVLGFIISYIFLALAYIVAPKLKMLKFMRSPCAKFIAHVFFYLILLAMLLWTTIVALPYRLEDEALWSSAVNVTTYFRQDASGQLLFRSGQTPPVHYLIFVWVLGLFWQEVKELYRDGLREHLSSVLNWFDMFMLILYLISYGFRFHARSRIEQGAYYFRNVQSLTDGNITTDYYPIDLLDMNDTTAVYHYGWTNPDRFYWDYFDPVIVAEGLFAIANVLDFARFASLLPAFESLGTLQISFGIMIKDILRFMGLFGLVFLAFMVGLANLYWFFGEPTRTSVELASHTATTAELYFGNLQSAFQYCFWSLFGMGEREAPEISTFKDFGFTQVIGQILYGLFMVCCVIILLNMLIAMMSLSFSLIQDDADVEWKFSRTQLFFDYMLPGATLPVPLNLIPTPKSLFYFVRRLCSYCCKKRGNKTNDITTEEKSASSKTDLVVLESKKVDETNATLTASSDPGLQSQMSKDVDDLFKYKAVVSRLVRRFISDTNSSQDDDKDDENLKNDLLRIRRELTNSLEMRSREIEQCRQDIHSGNSSFRKELGNCHQAIAKLEVSLNVISTAITHQNEELAKVRNQNLSDNSGQQMPSAPPAAATAPLFKRQSTVMFSDTGRVNTPAPVIPSYSSNNSSSLAAMVPASSISANTSAKYVPPPTA